MTGIYKITNPKSKVYIGQSVNIEKRFNQYKKIRCKSQVALYRSFLKYGIEKHIFEIIEECSIELLNEKENLKNKFSKIILNLQTGVFYLGTKEAAFYNNLNHSTLKNRLNGNLKNNTNLIYC